MNLEPLIAEIVNSPDPVEAFSKVASDLDERWKITLAREVNKNLFQKKLQEAPLNENIEFDVITVPNITKVASEQKDVNNPNLEKIASEKRKKITPDMFSFKEQETYKDYSTYYEKDALFDKEINHRKKAEIEQEIEQRKEIEKIASDAIKYILEEEKEIRYKDIARNLINSEEELKTFAKMALDRGMEEECRKVISYYNPDMNYFRKTASAILSLEKKASFEKELDDLEYLNKEALNDLQKKVIDLIITVPSKGVTLVGKTVSPALRLPGIIGAAAKKTGKFIYKHPVLATSGAIAVGSGLAAMSNASKKTYSELLGK